MCLGIPGQIVEITDAERNLALAEVSNVRREVNVTCVLDENGGGHDKLIGSWVLIHVGFAMNIIDEEEASETMKTLIMLGEAQDEIEAMMMADEALSSRR